MEGEKKWHHGVPDDTQYAAAIEELQRQRQALEAASSISPASAV
jgi:hypothetical protein